MHAKQDQDVIFHLIQVSLHLVEYCLRYSMNKFVKHVHWLTLVNNDD